MKRIIKIFYILIPVLLLLCACGKDDLDKYGGSELMKMSKKTPSSATVSRQPAKTVYIEADKELQVLNDEPIQNDIDTYYEKENTNSIDNQEPFVDYSSTNNTSSPVTDYVDNVTSNTSTPVTSSSDNIVNDTGNYVENNAPIKRSSYEKVGTPSTKSQEQALKSARDYLNFMAFSHDGLVNQLEYEQFSTQDAIWAADNCGADWFEEALRSGKAYLDYSGFSYNGLIDQLEFEKFTYDQAKYAADQLFGYTGSQATQSNNIASSGGTVSQLNALRTAGEYLAVSGFSYSGLVKQLEFDGYSESDARYAVDNCGADWYEQAARSAREYLNVMGFSRQGLIDQLVFDGYTYEQADYGVSMNGF